MPDERRDHRVLDSRVRDSDAAAFEASWGVPTHGAVEHPLGPDGRFRHGPCQERKGRAGPARGSTGTFDKLRETVPIAEIPGLGDLYDAYSKAIGGIADSVGKLEESRKQIEKAYRDLGFEGQILIKPKSRREQLADTKGRVGDELRTAEAAMAAACDAGPDDPCFDDRTPCKAAMDKAYRAAGAKLDARATAVTAAKAAGGALIKAELKVDGLKESIKTKEIELQTLPKAANPGERRRVQTQITNLKAELTTAERALNEARLTAERKRDAYLRATEAWREAMLKVLREESKR